MERTQKKILKIHEIHLLLLQYRLCISMNNDFFFLSNVSITLSIPKLFFMYIVYDIYFFTTFKNNLDQVIEDENDKRAIVLY